MTIECKTCDAEIKSHDCSHCGIEYGTGPFRTPEGRPGYVRSDDCPAEVEDSELHCERGQLVDLSKYQGPAYRDGGVICWDCQYEL